MAVPCRNFINYYSINSLLVSFCPTWLENVPLSYTLMPSRCTNVLSFLFTPVAHLNAGKRTTGSTLKAIRSSSSTLKV